MRQSHGEPTAACGVKDSMSNLHYTLWSIWGELPILPKLFFLILILVSIYTLFSAAVIVVRLHSLRDRRQVGDVSSIQCSLAALQARSANVRQLIGATFYFFGFIYFLALPLATLTLDSKIPLEILILRNFLMYFAFAANVFFIFLVLHSVQWVVSSRVHAHALRLNAQKIV
jgi:hypothetical protein